MTMPEVGETRCWAGELEGRELGDGWIVGERVRLARNHSGGRFSQCYEVRRGTTRGFLKALDVSPCLAPGIPKSDQLRLLKEMLEAFFIEKDLYGHCGSRRMDHVVSIIGHGEVEVSVEPIVGTVHFVILERADRDIRELVDASSEAGLAARLRCLHGATTALRQLHGGDVAHQDLKPSNLLQLEERTKVGDLGSASKRGLVHPREFRFIQGDPTYAPPESLYEYEIRDWDERRLGCDLYLLGGLSAFLLAGTHVTQALRRALRDEHRWQNWNGRMYLEVLPYLQAALSEVLAEFVAPNIPKDCQELVLAISQLCEPDPRERGWVLSRKRDGGQYDLQRYQSRLDWLAARVAGARLVPTR